MLFLNLENNSARNYEGTRVGKAVGQQQAAVETCRIQVICLMKAFAKKMGSKSLYCPLLVHLSTAAALNLNLMSKRNLQ